MKLWARLLLLVPLITFLPTAWVARAEPVEPTPTPEPAVSAAQLAPIAMRIESESLGRGGNGTVLRLEVFIAPEDAQRLKDRVRLAIELLDGEDASLHRSQSVVAFSNPMEIYRELPAASGTLVVAVSSLDGMISGIATAEVEIPVMSDAFIAPDGAPIEARAMEVLPPAEGGVRIKPPTRQGGLGGLVLEVEAPQETRRIVFDRDGEIMFTLNRPPWRVDIPLGDIITKTQIRASAWGLKDRFLGEDAVVLNAPGGQLAVALLFGPVRDGRQPVTVSVGAGKELAKVELSADDEVITRWSRCPCRTEVEAGLLSRVSVVTASAEAVDGTVGEAIYLARQGQFADTIDVDIVELSVVVLGPQGVPIIDLRPEEFRVLEDGEVVEIEDFGRSGDRPLSLALAVDTSGSMIEVFDEVKVAVEGFAKSLVKPGDQVALLTFSFDAGLKQGWTSDVERIKRALDRVEVIGGTSLLDALVRGLEEFRGLRGQQALVLLSDGADTTSRTPWNTTLRFVQTMRVPVFPIGFAVSKLDFGARSRLNNLTEATGGESFFPKNPEQLEAVYARIAELLRSQYLLTYSAPYREEEGFRKVTVEVSRPGAKVRTISGYYRGR